MYFWNPFPFLRFSLALIVGIVCAEHIYWLLDAIYLFSAIILLTVLLLFTYRFGYFSLRHLLGSTALFAFVIIGAKRVQQVYIDLPTAHYTNFTNEMKGFVGIVNGPGVERERYFRYSFRIKAIYQADSLIESNGLIFLYIRKDSASSTHSYGDELAIEGHFFDINPPGNPHEFNYKAYLRLQGIHAQAFVKPHHVHKINSTIPNHIFAVAYKLQRVASNTIDRCIPSKRENGIAKALLLGIKDHLDNDIRSAYSAAGAMHVLAVSGLHVGIVYMLIQLLLGKFKSTRLGRSVFSLLSIIAIWCYAIITGLSPSVLRAATMFSIIALGDLQGAKGNVYNSLGLAAFALLLVDPYLIYSVGFQLSFSAVFGIVYLQPKLYRLLSIHNWIGDKAWAITCVSLAAQISTFPLTAFYFHQFPTYFLVSNLVVIPAATVILVGGILMLIIDPLVSQVSELIGSLVNKILWIVNEVVSWISTLPYSLIEWIHLDQVELALTISILIIVIGSFHFKSFKTMTIGVLAIATALLFHLFKQVNQSQVHSLTIYQVKNAVAIDHVKGFESMLYVQAENLDPALLAYQINPNRMTQMLSPIDRSSVTFERSPKFHHKTPFTFGQLASTKILIVDSTTFHLQFHQNIATDLLIIENESVKSLEWLLKHFTFKFLVIGNRNSRSFIRKMETQASNIGIPIHIIPNDGAFVLDVRK